MAQQLENIQNVTTQLMEIYNLTSSSLLNNTNVNSSISTSTSTSISTTIANSNNLNLTTVSNANQLDAILINKLEQLSVSLDTAFGNFSIERNELQIALGNEEDNDTAFLLGAPIAAGRAPPPHATHHGGDVEVEHVVGDIWIGVILTLLIVSVIFFICSCFLYHKFQQWKNSYRTNRNEPVEVCHHCPPDFEAESLPSYTIVSGLPTYDDALEEFRKAGVILAPQPLVPIIKIFESNSKDCQFLSFDQDFAASQSVKHDTASDDYACDLPQPFSHSMQSGNAAMPQAQVIELTPEQLAMLSQKRLSLQISFGSPYARRNSRTQRSDLRNRLLRSRAESISNAEVLGNVLVHSQASRNNRRCSVGSINLVDSANQQMHHRGSLC